MLRYNIRKLENIPNLPQEAILCVATGDTDKRAIEKLYSTVVSRPAILRLDEAMLEIIVYTVPRSSWPHYEAVLVRKADAIQAAKGDAPDRA
jgi:hypothetical protein